MLLKFLLIFGSIFYHVLADSGAPVNPDTTDPKVFQLKKLTNFTGSHHSMPLFE
jgi:hypothetical protein